MDKKEVINFLLKRIGFNWVTDFEKEIYQMCIKAIKDSEILNSLIEEHKNIIPVEEKVCYYIDENKGDYKCEYNYFLIFEDDGLDFEEIIDSDEDEVKENANFWYYEITKKEYIDWS